MAPVKGQKKSSVGQWIDGKMHNFKKASKGESPKTNVQNRRRSVLLKRLEISIHELPSSPNSPHRASVRRTRRMSMAPAAVKTAAAAPVTKKPPVSSSKTSKSMSQKIESLSTGSCVAKMVASTSPRKPTQAIDYQSFSGQSYSSSSSSVSRQSRSFSRSTTTKSNKRESSTTVTCSESWIEQISSPKVFYRVSSPGKLMGAQRRKSYTTATDMVQVEMDEPTQKRVRERSESPVAQQNRQRASSVKKLRLSPYKSPVVSKRTTRAMRSASQITGRKHSTASEKSDVDSLQKSPKKPGRVTLKSESKAPENESLKRTVSSSKKGSQTPKKSPRTPQKARKVESSASLKGHNSFSGSKKASVKESSPSIKNKLSPVKKKNSPTKKSPAKIIKTLRKHSQENITATGEKQSPLKKSPSLKAKQNSPRKTGGSLIKSALSFRKSRGSPPKSTRSPKKSVRSPKKSTQSPKKSAGSPKKSAGSPKKSAGSPKKSAGSPKKSAGSPKKSAKSPKKSTQTPKESTQTPKESTQTPKKSTQTPKKSTQTPKKSTQTPKKSTQTPKKSTQTPKESTRTPKKSTRTPKKSKQTPKKSTRTPKKVSLSTKKSGVTLKSLDASPKKFSPSPSKTSSSPRLQRSGALTRSARRKGVKRVMISGASPTRTDRKISTPLPPSLKKPERKSLVVSVTDIGSTPVQLARYLSRGALIPPSPVNRLVKASRGNPFTPKPEAVPSKLLKQNMKKKVTTEISLKKNMSVSSLLDSSIVTPVTPRARGVGSALVPRSTPASSPALPPTPPSAKYASRSYRMVATARRNISHYREETFSPSAAPRNSTPHRSSPLYTSYLSASRSSNDESNGHFKGTSVEEMSTDDSTASRDFTASRFVEEQSSGVQTSSFDTSEAVDGARRDRSKEVHENQEASEEDNDDDEEEEQEDEEEQEKEQPTSKKGYCSLM